jgi:segregation and condensation protein B
MTYQSDNLPQIDLEPCLEALLFVAGGPVSIGHLATVLERTPEKIRQGLKSLEAQYQENRGLGLQWFAGKVQLTTNAQLSPYIEMFLGLEIRTRLSQAALEALSIIAYRQPVTRPGIDAIRGVSSDGVLKSLLSKGLIQEIGRAEGPGRPILYTVTADFLQYFGLSSVDELPPFEEEVDQNKNELENNGILKD